MQVKLPPPPSESNDEPRKSLRLSNFALDTLPDISNNVPVKRTRPLKNRAAAEGEDLSDIAVLSKAWLDRDKKLTSAINSVHTKINQLIPTSPDKEKVMNILRGFRSIATKLTSEKDESGEPGLGKDEINELIADEIDSYNDEVIEEMKKVVDAAKKVQDTQKLIISCLSLVGWAATQDDPRKFREALIRRFREELGVDLNPASNNKVQD